MQTQTLKAKLARAAAGSAVAAMVAATLMVGGNPVGADPKQFDTGALVTVGSDTTQDVLDAFTGEVNGTRFLPVRSASRKSAAGVELGQQQIVSWRAVDLTATGGEKQCIEPSGGILVDRVNGSGNGRKALSTAHGLKDHDGSSATPPIPQGWGFSAIGCTSNYASTSGLFDFSRSSSGAGTSSATDLTYIPFARDALQFAYSAPDAASAVSNLTTTQVRDLHNNAGGSAVLAGATRVIACRIQSGSGTYESWNSMMLNPTATTLGTSTGECAKAFDTTQQKSTINGIQEHDPQGLYDACERIRNGYVQINAAGQNVGPDGVLGNADDNDTTPAQPTTQCIIGYSVANWVAQFNGVGSRSLDVDDAGTDAPPTASTGGAFNIGTRDAAAIAGYNIVSGKAVPNTTYYADATFGRDVYNVVPTTHITLGGRFDMKSMLLCDGPDDTDGDGAQYNGEDEDPVTAGIQPETDETCDSFFAGHTSGASLCSAEAAVIRDQLGFAASAEECGRYGAFNKRGWDFGSGTGTIGAAEV